MKFVEAVSKKGLFERKNNSGFMLVDDDGIKFYLDKECKNLMDTSTQYVSGPDLIADWIEVKEDVYPKIFENDSRRVVVLKNGSIDIINKIDESVISFFDSLPVLFKAVKLSEKILNKQKED